MTPTHSTATHTKRAADLAASSGRDARGRFATDNPGKPAGARDRRPRAPRFWMELTAKMGAGVVRFHVASRRYVLFNPSTQEPLTGPDGNWIYNPTHGDVAAVAILYGALHPQDTAKFTEYWREALDLIALFLRETAGSPLLGKWFEGEIVENVKAREALEDQIKDTAAKSGISVRGMKAGIYGGLSKYSHVSYIALLEAFDIFHHDFDFERIAGYHWVLTSSLPYLRTEIHSGIITLKAFYSAIADGESYLGVDTLLRKYAPHMYDEGARKARTADFRARFDKK